MSKLRSLLHLMEVGAVGLAMGCASGALAAPVAMLNAIPYSAASVAKGAFGCDQRARIPAVPNGDAIGSQSKSAAILGGEPSALELIRRQQAKSATVSADFVGTQPVQRLEPSASRAAANAPTCSFSTLAVAPFARGQSSPALRSEDFLASRRVEISRTSFDDDWLRVSNEKISASLLGTIDHKLDRSVETVELVNRWVNRRITYVEDRELFGSADYWAGAGRTVALGKGDCEDIALTKMQILEAAGFHRKDMFLTIARDTITRADHALLILRLDDRFVALDNATDELLNGASSHSYVPVLSFNDDSTWIHGF